MVYRFLIRHAHGTSVNNNSLATSKIINRENPPSQGDPTKAYNPWGAFIFQILERGGKGRAAHNDGEKGGDREHPVRRSPLYSFITVTVNIRDGWLTKNLQHRNKFFYICNLPIAVKKKKREIEKGKRKKKII